jgi:hypothetical protein
MHAYPVWVRNCAQGIDVGIDRVAHLVGLLRDRDQIHRFQLAERGYQRISRDVQVIGESIVGWERAPIAIGVARQRAVDRNPDRANIAPVAIDDLIVDMKPSWFAPIAHGGMGSHRRTFPR